jgi:monoamine oxidase
MDSENDALSLRGRQRRLLLQVIGGGAVAGALALGVRTPAQASQEGRDHILDVAIIGGGLSGLTSARDLHRAGCESFVVLEARNRVGGRTYDHDLGHSVISEGGGQWIGPGQTAIADLARQLEIDTFDTYYRGKTVYLAGDARVAQEVADGGANAMPRSSAS